MRLAAHQPDLLPYPGFWWKMAHCDVFDIALYDQFQKAGYQRRVKMMDNWCSLPIQKPFAGPIYDVRLAPNARQVLIDTIVGRYSGHRYWKREAGWLLDAIDDSGPSVQLTNLNANLIYAVMERLGIETKVKIARPLVMRGIDGLIELCKIYGADEYLSGIGGREYMGDNPEAVFADAGIRLVWSEHKPVTSDSVLTVLMTHRDPVPMIIG